MPTINVEANALQEQMQHTRIRLLVDFWVSRLSADAQTAISENDCDELAHYIQNQEVMMQDIEDDIRRTEQDNINISQIEFPEDGN